MKKGTSAARRAKRHPEFGSDSTNRKATRGRKVHYQDVLDDDGNRTKTIKHNQS